MKNFLNIIQDYWEAIGIFVGVILGVYDIVANATTWGLITPNWILPTGVILFFSFGIVAIIKSARKARSLNGKVTELENRLLESSAEVVKVKAESAHQTGGQNIAAEIVNFYGDNEKSNHKVDLKNYDEISSLMNKAVEDANWFANGFQFAGEPSFEEKQKIAFQSGKAFHEYFGNRRHYFSENARELLEKLDILIFTSIRSVVMAKGSGDAVWWSETSQKLNQESKTLREKIINEFQKNPTK